MLTITKHRAAYLMLQTGGNRVNVIITNSMPVSQRLRIEDERFAGLVIPLATGNLILVGEGALRLESYRDLFSNNQERLI